MKLQAINIHRSYSNNDLFEGSIRFEGSFGEVSLKLTEELSEKVLAVCAEAIVQSSQEVAEAMTKSLLEHEDNGKELLEDLTSCATSSD